MNWESILKYIKRFGTWILFPLALVVAFLFWLCITEKYNTSGFFPDFLNVKCGCDEQKQIIINLQEQATSVNKERNVLAKELEDLDDKLKQTTKELQASNNSNEILIGERDSLIARRNELLNLLAIKDSTILANEILIDSLKRINPGQPQIDSGYINVKITEYDSLKRISDILNNVYITDIQVIRINDSQIKIKFNLKGISTLRKYYLNAPVILKVKVFDEGLKNYIELVEKNPMNNRDKNQAQSVLIKFETAKGDDYFDNCFFSNTQYRPFKKNLFINKQFNIQFYFPQIDSPLSYYPSKLKKRD